MSSDHRTLSPPPETPSPLQWVPVLRLSADHRPQLLAHLLALGDDDRYLRFGYVATDEQIGRYVDGLDFDRDELFGVIDRSLAVIAATHLAYDPDPDTVPATAEFGISVSAHVRRNGVGRRLFRHAQLRARVRGVQVLQIHALSENQAMLRLLRSAGAAIQRNGGDADAVLLLAEADASTRLESWVEAGAAGLDYTAKRLTRRRATPAEDAPVDP